MYRITVIVIMILAVVPGGALASIPRTITIQGVLTDGSGTVVPTGMYSITFRLYDEWTGGTLLWEETQDLVSVTKGIFTTALGVITSLDLPFDEQYFLGISVGGEEELAPRIRLTSNAYSLRAGGVFGVSNVVPPSGPVGIGTLLPAEKLEVAGGVRIGTTTNENAGTIRFSAGDFEGYDGSVWKSLTGTGGTGLPEGTAGQTLRHSGSDWVATSNLYNGGTAIGIGTTNPAAPLDITGGNNWDLASTEGDLRIGDDTYRLKIGVATDGLGAGISRIRAQGGMNKLILGANTADVVSIESDGTVTLGSIDQASRMYIYGLDYGDPAIVMSVSQQGGTIYTMDEIGSLTAVIAPDNSVGNVGGVFGVLRDVSETGFIVDGNYNGYMEPLVGVHGSSRSVIFNMHESGNSSVQLPQGSISSSEIENEPGGVSYSEGNIPTSINSTATIIASQTMTAPSSGYVLVIGTCQLTVDHVYGTPTDVSIGVSSVSTTLPINQDVALMLPTAAASGPYMFPVTCSGFFEVAAGSNTFYLLGDKDSGTITATDIQLTAIFVPTSYGTVEPTAAADGGGVADGEMAVITEADVEEQRAVSEAANLARLERELSEIRSEIEALKEESERQLREAASRTGR